VPPSVLTPAIRAEIDRLGRADVVVGIPSFKNATTIGHVTRAAQAGLVQYFADLRPLLVNSDAGSPDGTQRVVAETEPPDYVERILLVRPTNRLERLTLTYPEVDGVGGKGAALRTIFEIASALDAHALVVVDSDLRSITPEWIELLAGPILKGGFDFVTPQYARHKYDGTITNTVTYPLTRALYGRRIRQPIGGDFGVSGDLVRHYLAQDDWSPEVSRFGIDIWMTTIALIGASPSARRGLGAKVHDPKDPSRISGRCSARSSVPSWGWPGATRAWLDIHNSHEVPAYGFERWVEPSPLQVNTLRLLSEFGAGQVTLAETWRAMLAPVHAVAAEELAVEAAKLADTAYRRLGLGGTESGTDGVTTDQMSDAVAGFHFPDELWAGIVYDLVVIARFGAMPIERLVAALVPLYFGRVGSLVVEARHLDQEDAEERVERQARTFELRKPYLVERWNAAEESERVAEHEGEAG